MPQAKECGRGVAAPAAEPTRRGYALRQVERRACRNARLPLQQARRGQHEVLLHRRSARGFDRQTEVVGCLERHLVREADRLQDRPHLVVAVGAASEHLERQVDFRGSEQTQHGCCYQRRLYLEMLRISRGGSS